MRAKEKKPINIEVGKNIRLYREMSGYSREKLAELLGLTPRFIADAESGVVGVSLSTLRKICTVLGISADRILWNSEPVSPGLDEMVAHLDPELVDSIKDFVRLHIEFISKIENNKTEG